MKYIVTMGGNVYFVSWEEATSKAGKVPTTTKWIDCVKKGDDGHMSARGARLQTKTRGFEGRLVRGDTTAGVSIRCRGGRDENRAWTE